MEDLKKLIREVPDFPKPGILFYDITTLLKDKCGFRSVIDGLQHHYAGAGVDVVLGIEARGFIFAPALAYALNAGFVPVRKPKKLPAECATVTYVLATGGTAKAATQLVEQLGGTVVGLAFAIELTFLNGRQKLTGYDAFSLL